MSSMDKDELRLMAEEALAAYCQGTGMVDVMYRLDKFLNKERTPADIGAAIAAKLAEPASMRWNPNTSQMEPHSHLDDLGMSKK